MTTSLNPPVGWLPDSTNAENEIREIFVHHWDKMKDHLIAVVSEINAWRHKVIEDTNKYADDQIQIVTADYERLRLNLNERCEENLDTTRAYAVAQNIELFNELRSACQSLEFQMAHLEYINGTMKGPKVITIEEQVERKKKEKSEVPKSDNDNPEETPTIEHANDIQNNRSEKEDLTVKVVSSISNESYPNSSLVEPSNDDNPSNYDNNESKRHIMHGTDSSNKCPICFMIFPMSMTDDDRSQHVNEHCTDN